VTNPTLHQVLASLNYTTRPAGNYRKEIIVTTIIAEETVYTGTAHDVWSWLRRTGQHPRTA